VSDYNGYLYNKDKVIEFLLNKKKKKETFKELDMRIGSLNDIVQLNIDLASGVLRCPLSNTTVYINKDVELKLTDIQFSYIVPCGCTMNTKVLNELTNDDDTSNLKCPVCSTSYERSNIIDINPQDEKMKKRLQNRMDKLKELKLYHNLKPRKTKKRKVIDKEGQNKKVKSK
jgi:hypothetical protein